MTYSFNPNILISILLVINTLLLFVNVIILTYLVTQYLPGFALSLSEEESNIEQDR